MTSEKTSVLVVDDEAANRKLLADMLSREGLSVLLASGGAEALALIEAQPIHVVLLDLMMPEVDGMSVLHTLDERGFFPALPVVVVTATDDRDVRRAALLAGAIDFLCKPLDQVEVVCKVKALSELGKLRSTMIAQAHEAAEREQLHRVEEAVRGLPLVVYEMNLGSPLEMSGSWVVGDMEGHHGVSKEDFLSGQDWLARIHPDDRERVSANLGRMLGGELSAVTDRFRLEVRGVHRWRQTTASFDPETSTIRGALLSIEEQVAIEDQLAQSQKLDALGGLTGGIAHDFNNLLGVILSFGGFARDALPDGDQAREDIIEVINAAERAAGLTRQLLTFSRQQAIENRAIDLDDRLNQSRKLVEQGASERVQVELERSPHPSVVSIDTVRFDQLLMNFAVNARDAMPDGGHLRITIDADPPDVGARSVRLIIADTGVGMSQDIQSRIFEPFFTTKPKDKGTGLGLSTCFGIVAEAGGTIEVDSAPGAGTTFTITLPAFDGPAEPPDPPAARIRPGRGEDVLVAEDDAALRRVVARTLEGAGYRVHLAEDGARAIQMIDELGSSLRVIVSDVIMPRKNGYEVAAHAATVLPHVPVLLMSGYMDGTVDQRGHEDLRILWKPASTTHILRSVGEALDAAGESATEAVTLHVLIVEDDPVVQRLLVRVVEAGGFEAHSVGTIADARQLLEGDFEPDRVLCDLSLPDGSGAVLLEWIAATRPELADRCIVLTGGATDDDGNRLVRSQRFRVLAKPVSRPALIEALSAAARR